MSPLRVLLFQWVQSAGFYREFHEQAVAAVRVRPGGDWLDVGCGPGLLTRIAASHGYAVTGADLDPAMIAAAQETGGDRVRYLVRSLDALRAEGRTAAVVSASSLLVVVPDPRVALRQLIQLVRPGGTLVVVEANNRFGWWTAFPLFLRSSLRGRLQLLLWLLVRTGRTLETSVFRDTGLPFRQNDLLEGMVTAWILKP